MNQLHEQRDSVQRAGEQIDLVEAEAAEAEEEAETRVGAGAGAQICEISGI
jgi:hypothetical protein